MGDSFFANYSILFFPVCMSILALFFLSIGLAAVIKNKPVIIHTKWLLVIALLSITPIFINGIIINASLKGISVLFFSILYSLLIIIIIVSLLLIRSYSIFCARDIDIRDAVIYSLNNNSLEFREKINKFYLININNELKISFPSMMEFTGNGTITMKNEPPRSKLRGIWNVEQFPNRRLVREEIYYTVWFNTKFLKVSRCLSRSKLRGIKPDFRIKKIN